MPRQEDMIDNWITAKEAADILTRKSGHTVSDAYVRRLGNPKKLALIAVKQVDARTKLYSKRDVEAYQVKPRGDGSVRRIARAPRGKKQEESAA
jgi:hypothetical protein